MSLYNGFSTYNRNKKFQLSDFDLVKQNLFNHFNIRRGEKLMNPNFGTVIWGLIFEPLTPEVEKVILDDVKSIVGYDPRIATDSIELTEFERGLQVALTITYLPENKTQTLSMMFDRDNPRVSKGKFGDMS